VGDCPLTLAIDDARQSSRHQCPASRSCWGQVRVQQDHAGHLQGDRHRDGRVADGGRAKLVEGAGDVRVQRAGGTVQARRHRRHLRRDLRKRQPQCARVASHLFSPSAGPGPHHVPHLNNQETRCSRLRDDGPAAAVTPSTAVIRQLLHKTAKPLIGFGSRMGPTTSGRPGMRTGLSGFLGCSARLAVRWSAASSPTHGCAWDKEYTSAARTSAGRTTTPVSCWPTSARAEPAAPRASR
jgi:hypothetical protein